MNLWLHSSDQTSAHVTKPKTANDGAGSGCRGKYGKAACAGVKNIGRKARQQFIQWPSANTNGDQQHEKGCDCWVSGCIADAFLQVRC